jgi:hypothetical protein
MARQVLVSGFFRSESPRLASASFIRARYGSASSVSSTTRTKSTFRYRALELDPGETTMEFELELDPELEEVEEVAPPSPSKESEASGFPRQAVRKTEASSNVIP